MCTAYFAHKRFSIRHNTGIQTRPNRLVPAAVKDQRTQARPTANPESVNHQSWEGPCSRVHSLFSARKQRPKPRSSSHGRAKLSSNPPLPLPTPLRSQQPLSPLSIHSTCLGNVLHTNRRRGTPTAQKGRVPLALISRFLCPLSPAPR